jgi:putative oxidoreductase
MSYDVGMLVLRLVVGGIMIGHGAQKLFGWFGGYGLAGTSGFFAAQLRLRPATFWTVVAGLTEAGSGLLLATGLLNPLGSLGIVAVMLMAVILAHWPRFWVTDNGIEYHLVLIAAAVAVALAGPGVYSLDAVLGIVLPAPAAFLGGLVLVLAGVVVALATRAPAPVVAAPVVAAPVVVAPVGAGETTA